MFFATFSHIQTVAEALELHVVRKLLLLLVFKCYWSHTHIQYSHTHTTDDVNRNLTVYDHAYA